MADNNEGNRGLIAIVMMIGLGVGLVLYYYLAFIMRIPGFESAPAAIVSWLIALIIATILGRGNRRT